MMTEHENGLCGEGGIGKGRTWNGENGLCGEGRIEKAKQGKGIGMAEHGMTAYPLLP
jgi:hypothetical protein